MADLADVEAIAAHAQSDDYAINCGITYGHVRAAVDRVRTLEAALDAVIASTTLVDAKAQAGAAR